MEKLVKQSKRWMTAVGVVAFLMVAGWQGGADGTAEVFTEAELALENAVGNSGGPSATVTCYDSETVGSGPHHNRVCVNKGKAYCEFDCHGSFTLGTCTFN